MAHQNKQAREDVRENKSDGAWIESKRERE
jgi:hypothetical protein